MKNHVCASDGNFQLSPKTQQLHEVVEDLELSLEVNKSLFKSILQSKTSQKIQSSEDSEASHMISSKTLTIIQQEDARLQDAINRIKAEISEAETLISISEERTKQSRTRRKDLNTQAAKELTTTKAKIHQREEEIRRLEKYLGSIEEIFSKSSKQEVLSPDEIIAEGKALVKKVSRQLTAAESLKDIEEKKCREAEVELKKAKSNPRVGAPDQLADSEKILRKDYGLNLNFENFWYVGVEGYDELSDSIRSSDSSVEGVFFPDKVEMPKKAKPKLPKLNFDPISPVKDAKAVKDTPQSKLSRLELVYQIKGEEIQSLLRVLADLQAIESSLTKGLEEANS